MIVNPVTTVRDLVLQNHRAAAVFQRHGLDFCLGGGVTIEGACREMGINAGRLLADLDVVLNAPDPEYGNALGWEADFLAEYIVQRHHRYVRSVRSLILEHALKVARRHGDAVPELIEIAKICSLVQSDLEEHMAAEERILFPAIKKLAQAARKGKIFLSVAPGTIRRQIRMLEPEHTEGEHWMARIRELSRDYTLAVDGCITCTVLFRELEEFERDMRRHIDLERNILFPKALELESRVCGGITMLP